MRRVILAAGLCVLTGLAACDSSKPTTVAAPPPPKSLARSQQMYQGQELISKIDTAEISIRSPTVLDMHVAGSVGMAGYKNAAFLPRINPFPPKDGVYEVDVVADKPATPGATVQIYVGNQPLATATADATYSNYAINQGLSDSLFQSDK